MNELILQIVTILRNRIEGLTDIKRVNEEIKLLDLINQLKVVAEDPSEEPITADDLATVATTGSYADLSGTPTLGTASASNVEDFATSAQGDLADSAVQPADLGTAASSDIGDFATAAQGTLAGTAIQPGDNVSTLTNDSGYITGTTGFSGSFVTATDTITVVNGLITSVTPL